MVGVGETWCEGVFSGGGTWHNLMAGGGEIVMGSEPPGGIIFGRVLFALFATQNCAQDSGENEPPQPQTTSTFEHNPTSHQTTMSKPTHLNFTPNPKSPK